MQAAEGTLSPRRRGMAVSYFDLQAELQQDHLKQLHAEAQHDREVQASRAKRPAEGRLSHLLDLLLRHRFS